MFIQEQVTIKKQIKQLGSALTFEGLSINDASINAMFDWIEKYTPVKQRKIYVINGSLMNKLYNADYNDDIHIVCVALDDIQDVSKIIIPKLAIGAKWLDDIIDNLYKEDDDDNIVFYNKSKGYYETINNIQTIKKHDLEVLL